MGKKQTIAFDVDYTLLIHDKPNYKVIELLKWFQELGWDIVIHSGGGMEYCQQRIKNLGLEPYTIAPKGTPHIVYDIAVDDALDGAEHSVGGRSYRVKALVYIVVKTSTED